MTLRVGLIGCGGIMRPHIEGWKGISDRAEIVAMADVSTEAMDQRMALRHVQSAVAGLRGRNNRSCRALTEAANSDTFRCVGDPIS